ncbi:MAG: methyl-accepting chemotaxis protein [Deltaproteobacteria bacterium]|nr:methyl-accepting chemotaxis protein [Deltaproteobacteria bacterium]
MKLPFRGLSNIQKFFITLSVLFVIAIVDYQSFIAKSKRIEVYDDLNFRISAIRVSITKLEYLLDMFAVARRFENTTVELIKGDVDNLDENVNAVLGNPRYAKVLKDDTLLSEGMNSIADDWQTIKNEINRLNNALSQDEIMLIHNAVDMNSVMVTEKSDRLLSIIAESRKGVFEDTKTLALESIVGFILIVLLASLFFQKRVVSPANRAASVARRVLTGDYGARFHENNSAVGRLNGELNRMLESVADSLGRKDRKGSELAAESLKKTGQIDAVRSILELAGRSLSQDDLFSASVRMAAAGSGAEGAAIYIYAPAPGGFRLKAATGFDDNLIKDSSFISSAESGLTGEGGSAAFGPGEGLLGGAFRAAPGFKRFIAAPMEYNREMTGLVVAGFKTGEPAPSSGPFLEAVASALAVSAGHTGLFQAEHASRRFLERVIHQMPFGLVVFDKSGTCLMMNSVLKRLLGAEQKFSPEGRYRFIEDEVLSSQGMITSIKKSYEGYATEFIINYNPGLFSRYNFTSAPKRFKIKSFPLYDAGGEISNIALLYEDLTDAQEINANPGDAL